ncbi:MAG: hypothetical protein JWN10_1712 [Solirubrobacterales bacterium]|nr:hypothetical protein [Solirubrobacterales bacterium]
MREGAALRRLTLFRILAGAYALFATIAPRARLPSLCPFRRMTGIRCPLCGLTHATRALTRGDIGNAVALHPFAPLLWVAAALALTRRQETS